MTRCYEQDVDAPRVGCGCRECYHARERALDPNLLALARGYYRPTITCHPATAIVYRGLVEYLSGRLEYAALHTTIIKALMELADRQFEHSLSLVNLRSPQFIVPMVDP